jgi:hypothetical protein
MRHNMPEEKEGTIKKGAYKVWFDEESKTLNVIVSGEVSMPLVDKMIQETTLLMDGIKTEVKIKCLIDVTKVTKPIVSSSSRKAMYGGIKNLLNSMGKTAIVGAGTLIKVTTKFVFSALGKKDMEYFTDKEEALKWLKED